MVSYGGFSCRSFSQVKGKTNEPKEHVSENDTRSTRHQKARTTGRKKNRSLIREGNGQDWRMRGTNAVHFVLDDEGLKDGRVYCIIRSCVFPCQRVPFTTSD